MSETVRCPACDDAQLRVFAEIRGVPVHCNVLHDSAESARAADRGDIVLGFCDACSLVYNVAFDPDLLSYDQEYENSLHFSPTFREYADELAARLLAPQGGTDLDIIEIGCGKGEFLRLLTAGGENRCLGFDTSFEESANPTAEQPGLTIHNRFFLPAEEPEVRADLLLSRHVLEHIGTPTAFVREISHALKDHDKASIFFEVPNGLWTVEKLGIWDLIYEHCTYFTEPALRRVFGDAGLCPTHTETAFGDQFLSIQATRAGTPATIDVDEIARIGDLCTAFGDHFATKCEQWSTELRAIHERGETAVVWGAGSKGTTFLNIVTGIDAIHGVIDINPRKTGRFVPGAGLEIHTPDWLRDNQTDVVLVMNPVYENEIRDKLTDVESSARTITV